MLLCAAGVTVQHYNYVFYPLLCYKKRRTHFNGNFFCCFCYGIFMFVSLLLFLFYEKTFFLLKLNGP